MKEVIWINGPFGAGKTTLADNLKEKIPRAIIFDPERFGFMIQSMVPPAQTEDFQDLRIWRRLVSISLAEFVNEYKRPILVPMTLVNPDYFEEIFVYLAKQEINIQHFFLSIDKKVLVERIKNQVVVADDFKRDCEVRHWRLSQIDRCLGFLDQAPRDINILDSGNCSPEFLAKQVLSFRDIS